MAVTLFLLSAVACVPSPKDNVANLTDAGSDADEDVVIVPSGERGGQCFLPSRTCSHGLKCVVDYTCLDRLTCATSYCVSQSNPAIVSGTCTATMDCPLGFDCRPNFSCLDQPRCPVYYCN